MNIQAYIESGILEEYVLGTVSPQEKQEVECMSHIYPEIREELLRTEGALEQYALKHQALPPASLKETLFAQMNFDENADQTGSAELNNLIQDTEQEDDTNEELAVTASLPVIEEQRSVSEIDSAERSLHNDGVVIYPSWAKLAVAASVLFAVLFGWSAWQMSDMRELNSRSTAEVEVMRSELKIMEKDAAYKQTLANLYRNPAYRIIRLAGLEKSPASAVSAIWDTKTNEVMLDVQQLPAAPEGKQYQLWSIVDGKPVDMGVLDSDFENKVIKMKPTKPGPVAFAITLEKTGGNPTPTMEDMFVMGKV